MIWADKIAQVLHKRVLLVFCGARRCSVISFSDWRLIMYRGVTNLILAAPQ
jgi:hypothetical protein